MRTEATFLFVLCFLAFIACSKKTESDSKEIAEDQNKETLDKDVQRDAEFAISAADGGLMEVKLGELALINGSSPQIKAFGQTMVDDHSKANSELAALTAQKQISIPATLSEKKQTQYDDLSKMKGSEFDKAYAKFMVEDHKEDIEAFKKEAEKGTDAGLKAWAAAKVPTLEHHLMMAEAAKKAVNP